MKQLSLIKNEMPREFGGSRLGGRRKIRRPLDTKRPLHLVLKAKQDFLLLRNRRKVEIACRKFAKRFGLHIYGFAVQADHLHMIMSIPKRVLYVRWIRAVTSELVRRISGLKWSLRPYTRIAGWGRDLRNLIAYVLANAGEAQVILKAHRVVQAFEIHHRRWH